MMNRKDFLLYVTSAGVVLLATLLFLRTSEQQTIDRESTFDRVERTKVLRVAYIPYSPAVIVDPNTKELSGIFVDTLRQLGTNLDLKIDFIAEEGFGSFSEGLKNDRYDIVCSNIWPSAVRSKHMFFSQALYFSGMCVWVRADDNRFDQDITLINDSNVRLATMDGEISELIAQSQFPKISRVAISQSSEFSLLMENVVSGKADVAFVEPYTVAAFLKNHPGALKNLTPTAPLRVYANTLPLPMDNKFKEMINVAIQELHNSGALEAIIDRYSGDKGAFFRTALPYRVSGVEQK